MGRARTKTFTGCWTCRARKLKCDLRRPKCLRCQKAGVECEGYSIKLRWSGNGNSDGSQDKILFRRRNVDFVEYPPHMIYETYKEMDDTLAKLHSPSFENDETISLGPFAVFEGIKRSSAHRITISDLDSPHSNSYDESTKGRQISPRLSEGPRLSESGPSTFNLSSTNQPVSTSLNVKDGKQNDNDGKNNNSNMMHSSTGTLTNTDSTISSGATSLNPIQMNNTITSFDDLLFASQDDKMEYDTLHDELSALLAADSSSFMGISNTNHSMEPSTSPLFSVVLLPPLQYYLSTDNQYGLPTNSLHFNYESRYLLDHYIKSVCPIMTVIAHPQSPWKSIHIPKVIVAIGDLVATGKTSSARNALLNAILAVSAFHLQREFTLNSDAQKHYLNFGLKLKSEAYDWLTESLTADLGKQKYKDVVASVLTMVSIDIIRGSMEDCPIHLAACQSIVKMRYRTRSKMSQRALVLHRISGFMTLMQGATALDPTSTQALGHTDLAKDDYDTAEQWMDLRFEDLGLHFASSGNGSAAEIISSSSTDASSYSRFLADDGFSLSYMMEPSQFLEYWDQYNTDNTAQWSEDFYSKELTSAQALHGIPDSLTVLFRLTCKLARQAVGCRTKGEILPKSFSSECADLEAALVSWQTRYDMNKNSDLQGHMKQAFNHHTLSFHEALIIYHYRITRNVHPSSIQKNVLNVLNHLDEMEKLNRGTTTPTITPLLFQAFIAACELDVTKIDLKERFARWLSSMSSSGLGGFMSTQMVVEEVWRRRASQEKNPEWWKIVSEWKLNLMLM